MNSLELNRAKGLLIHLAEQSHMAVKELFDQVGANYDRGDTIVLNAKRFPEYDSKKNLHPRIFFSHEVPIDKIGLIMKPLPMSK